MAGSTHRAAVAFALLLAAVSVSARPPESGFYVEADAGRTRFDLEKAELDHWSEIPAEASSLDRSDLRYSLAVGFRFSPYVAIEAAYLDLGKTRYLVEDNGAAARLDVGSKGPALSLLGAWPINRTWSLEGRAGLYFSDVDIETLLVGAAVGTLVVLDPEGTLDSLLFDYNDPPKPASGIGHPGWMLGAGVVASFGDHWSARLGYDYFNGKAAGLKHPVLGTELDSRAGRWTLGIRYLF